MRTRTLLISLVTAAAVARSAAALTIAEVLADPEVFGDKTVVLTGTVDAAVPVGTESGYNLREGNAVITVVSRTTPPPAGGHLAVTGTVHAFKADDEGAFPPFMFETSRSAAP